MGWIKTNTFDKFIFIIVAAGVTFFFFQNGEEKINKFGVSDLTRVRGDCIDGCGGVCGGAGVELSRSRRDR